MRNWDSYAKKKSDSKKLMLENAELAGKLKNGQFGVFSTSTSLDKSRQYLEKISLKEL